MAIVHPDITPEAYEALMWSSGWSAPIELLDQEAVVLPPSGGWAGHAHVRLAGHLEQWARATRDGGLLLADTFVLIDGHTVAPDVAYWTAERRPAVTQGRIEADPPDLVAEVVSPGTAANDLGPKRRIYREGGVAEYWIVDSAEQLVIVERAQEQPRTLRGDERLGSPLLPGFEITIASLFTGR